MTSYSPDSPYRSCSALVAIGDAHQGASPVGLAVSESVGGSECNRHESKMWRLPHQEQREVSIWPRHRIGARDYNTGWLEVPIRLSERKLFKWNVAKTKLPCH